MSFLQPLALSSVMSPFNFSVIVASGKIVNFSHALLDCMRTVLIQKCKAFLSLIGIQVTTLKVNSILLPKIQRRRSRLA